MSGVAAQAAPGRALAADSPQAIFVLSTAGTLDKIVNRCMDDEEPVTARDSDAVVCEVRMGTPERIAARLLLREPFAPAPRAFIRFSVVANAPGLTRVQVSGWVEDSRPLRDKRTAPLSGARFGDRMRVLLSNLGGRVRST